MTDTITMTQRQITTLITLVEQRDRLHADYRKAHDADSGTALGAARISDAAWALSLIYGKIDRFQAEVGNTMITRFAGKDAAHYRDEGIAWDEVSTDRWVEANA